MPISTTPMNSAVPYRKYLRSILWSILLTLLTTITASAQHPYQTLPTTPAPPTGSQTPIPSLRIWDLDKPSPGSSPGIGLELYYQQPPSTYTLLGSSRWTVSDQQDRPALTAIGTTPVTGSEPQDVIINATNARDLIITNRSIASGTTYGAIRFGTTPGSSSTPTDLERMTILNNGYVGIGRNDPQDLLNVHNGVIRVSATQSGVNNPSMGQLAVATSNGEYSNVSYAGDVVLRMTSMKSSDNAGNNHDMIFCARTAFAGFRFTTGNPDVERLTIFHDGNVIVRGPSAPWLNLGYSLGVNGGNGVILAPANKAAIFALKSSTSTNSGTTWTMANIDGSSKFVITTGDQRNTSDGGSNWTNAKFMVNDSGQVGIGTIAPGTYKLAVNGKISCREDLRVIDATASFPDYVFEKDYKLMPLDSLERSIQQNKHLPDIPSAQEVARDGIPVVGLQTKMLQKIEELTLYVIEQEKRIKALEEQNKKLQDLVIDRDGK